MIHGRMEVVSIGCPPAGKRTDFLTKFPSASIEPTMVMISHIDADWLGVQPCDILAGII